MSDHNAILTHEKARRLAAGLIERYVELCHKANISRETAAMLVALKPSRWSQLKRECKQPDEMAMMNAATFVSLYQANLRIEAALQEGRLPVASTRSEAAQNEALRVVLGREPHSSTGG